LILEHYDEYAYTPTGPPSDAISISSDESGKLRKTFHMMLSLA